MIHVPMMKWNIVKFHGSKPKHSAALIHEGQFRWMAIFPLESGNPKIHTPVITHRFKFLKHAAICPSYTIVDVGLKDVPNTSRLLLKCLLEIAVIESGHFSHRREYEDRHCISINVCWLVKIQSIQSSLLKEAQIKLK